MSQNKDLHFLLIVLRNSLILGGLYFVSVFATMELSYETCKPVIIFILSYIFTELARHYKLSLRTTEPKDIKRHTTLFYYG